MKSSAPDKCDIVHTYPCHDTDMCGDYKSSTLHTYPCQHTDKCEQCHTYPEAELFILCGTYKYRKYQLMPNAAGTLGNKNKLVQTIQTPKR